MVFWQSFLIQNGTIYVFLTNDFEKKIQYNIKFVNCSKHASNSEKNIVYLFCCNLFPIMLEFATAMNQFIIIIAYIKICNVSRARLSIVLSG